MPIDEKLAAAVRTALADTRQVREQKMFGGIGFMVKGNLIAGASSRGLFLRVGKDRAPKALAKPGTKPVVMRGRTMDGYIHVDAPVTDRAARAWVKLALGFVETLPTKKKKK